MRSAPVTTPLVRTTTILQPRQIDMGYQVYKLEINRPGDTNNKLEKHVALFVQTGEGRSGEMFHVIEDEDKTTRETIYFKFDRIAVQDLCLFSSICNDFRIGRIAGKDMATLRRICEQVPEVIAPQTERKPNCVSWFNNVLLELDQEGVVEFDKGFVMPERKEELQVVVPLADDV